MICDGPKNARIMLVGEAPGYEEIKKGKPFVGGSGFELTKMLQRAGIERSQCFLCNVTDRRPPEGVGEFFYKPKEGKKLGAAFYHDRYVIDKNIINDIHMLYKTISIIKPNVVCALGDMALWALTEESGITKWRGSIMESVDLGGGYKVKVIPTFNPAAVLRNYPWWWISAQDFRRVLNESFYPEIRYPKRNYILRPTLTQVIEYLEDCVRGKIIANDLETRGRHIACVGLAPSKNEAICIPFMSTKKQEGYWEPEEELQITLKLRDVLTDKNTRCIFQNGHFDTQVYATEWGYVPNVYADTMLMQHVAFPELRKSLDFISSFFASYYRFWKEDGKYWDPSIHDEDQFWIYNCDDCCYTYEDYEELDKCIDKMELRKPLEIKMATYMPLLEMMLRGVAIDQNLKARIGGDLAALMRERMVWFEGALGHPLNPLSNHPNGQMRKLLYEDLRVPPEMDRKTRRATLNDAAIDKIKHKVPLLRPLLEKVQEYRSLNVFKSTFADAKLSPDGRIRCSFNSAKVVTYRLSSSKNIWGEGANLQTIPKGTEEKGDKKDVDSTEILSDLRKPINAADS